MRPKHLAVLLAAAALISSPAFVVPASSVEPDPTPTAPDAAAPLAEPSAEELLDEAQAALAETDDASARVAPSTADDTDVTLLLRDLAARRNELSPADRKVANAILARPTGGATPFGVKYRSKAKSKCYAHVCIHWVTKGEDKPPLADGRDRDKLPEWVETNGRTAETVWRREVTRGGYRAPRADLSSANHGPNKKLDVYLANIGDSGLYGFCTSDDPAFARHRAISAYCVIDDDFSRREFGLRTKPIKTMQVTLAHEFFHAVQYSYDWLEDTWLLEGTAAWIEDQVYDDINDNLQYLKKDSPLTGPDIPLDAFDITDSFTAGGHRYGVWTFFQYLSEKYPGKYGGLPAVVRDIWAQADNSSSTRPRQYSTQAVNTALTKRGSSFADAFADFSARNLHPAAFYAEGASWRVAAPPTASCSGSAPVTCNAMVDHMSSSSTLRIRPADGVTSLTLSVAPAAFSGARAVLTIVPTSGRPSVQPIPVGGSPVVPFSTDTVQYAVVTMSNGNIEFQCNERRIFSCQGRPKHDNQVMSVTASVS